MDNNDIQSWLAHPFTKKLIKHCKEELERKLVFESTGTPDLYKAGFNAGDCRRLHLIINPKLLNDFIKFNEETND